MRRFVVFILCVAACTGSVYAQHSSQPIIETELERSEVVPGQYVSLRVTVLVPTWLPKPIEFPSMEMPNLRVRLPERSTGPVSRRIDGSEWAGVSRRYLLSPMVAGAFQISAQDILVTFAVPGSAEAVQTNLRTEPVTIRGVIPQGAETLDPFIAADNVILTQEVSQPTTGLQPGESIKRTVTAQISGASPIILPKLIPEVHVDGLTAYQDQPSISEQDDRGILSGTRTESVTLMAEGGATGRMPGIEIAWFNLKTGEIETAAVDGFDASVQGPPVSAPAHDRSVRALATAGLAALIVLGLLIFLIRRFWPMVVNAYHRRHDKRHASKDWAARGMKKAIRARDYPATLRSVDEWASRPPVTNAARTAPVYQALSAIGRSIYGRAEQGPCSDHWRAVDEAVKEALVSGPQDASTQLPPLNPASAANGTIIAQRVRGADRK